jgi:hypothetical protein
MNYSHNNGAVMSVAAAEHMTMAHTKNGEQKKGTTGNNLFL